MAPSKQEKDVDSTTSGERTKQDSSKSSLRSTSARGSPLSFGTSFDLQPLDTLSMQQPPSWRRRTQQREQYLVTSMTQSPISRQTSSSSQLQPSARPHFIFDQVLATHPTSSTHTLPSPTSTYSFSPQTISSIASSLRQNSVPSIDDQCSSTRLSTTDR